LRRAGREPAWNVTILTLENLRNKMAKHDDLIKNLTTLNQIVETLNRAVDVRQTLDFALTRLVELMGLETGWIFLVDPTSQNRWWGRGFILAAHHNLPQALGVNRARAWKGDCECQTLCQRGGLTDAYHEVNCSRLRNAPGDRRDLAVHASAPLRSGDHVLGILNVAAPDWDYFSEASLVLLANVGSQMGIALERARLFELLQEQRIHEQGILLELSKQLLGRSELEDILIFLVENIPQLVGVDACAILLPGDDPDYLDFWAASGWEDNPVTARRRVPADRRSGSGLVMETGESLLIEDFTTHDPTPFNAPWLLAEGFRGHAVVPLLVKNDPIGVMMIDSQAPLRLGDDRLRFLRLMANQAAIAIEKVRLHEEELKRQRLEDELAVGRQIQLGLLPESCPEVEGWEFAAFYQPARLVGGDFYDFFELAGDPDQMGLVIADVAGKGVPAALFMALSRSLIRTVSMSGSHPATVLQRANRMIFKDTRSKLFLTAFYATLDRQTGCLAYANAGHSRPLWIQAKNGEIQQLVARGTVMGVFEDIQLEEREVHLFPGDLVVFYTDGITEAMNENEQLFGEARLREAVLARPGASAQAMLESILQATTDFINNTPQADDLTLFVVKRQK
jgi:sigma-B regulation protein RsbU (phosphoserine phosphatase)